MFTLIGHSAHGRRGRLTAPHGIVETPFFLPVATAGALKGMTFDDVRTLGAEMILCNTYHLHLQPGENIVRQAGGLHEFIGRKGPILTDSGGFQVFSLRHMSAITHDGVRFQSHLNGEKRFLGPQEAMHIQHALGADVIMCFDQCPPSKSPRLEVLTAVERTLQWAAACKKFHEQLNAKRDPNQRLLLFGIVQGGLERDLREKCASELMAIGFDGYALGGLAVGESEEEMLSVVESIAPLLPEHQPRYLMGVGKIAQMKKAVALGIDMFDCVLPMREARHGTLYLSNGETIRIKNAQYRNDHSVIDADSPSPLSQTLKKSYLCHLLRSGERYGEAIACRQNIAVTLDAMKKLQEKIEGELKMKN